MMFSLISGDGVGDDIWRCVIHSQF
ncbi:hypothetical protein Q3G72_027594 [Acer saccharum]|nr:hypothetical protein Q3G72_027594 [Acer saccharum]